MKNWVLQEASVEKTAALASALQVPKELAALLLHRGIDNEAAAQRYLYPQWDDLSDPFAMLNMGAAVERIAQARDNHEQVAVYGDYDVDGMCATVLLVQALKQLGIAVRFHIPSRLNEGYGLNQQAVSDLVDDGVDLIITVDNGVSAHDIVDAFQDRVDFIITDHHRLPDILPHAIMVNPKLETTANVAFAHLCGCGVAFMLALATMQRLQPASATAAHVSSWSDLVAVATVADVVPLIGDNRTLTHLGMQQLQNHPRPGLAALIQLTGLQNGNIKGQDIAFQLAPRINACGRLEHTAWAVELLLTDDFDEALTIAGRVSELNEQRKEMEQHIFDEALAQVQARHHGAQPNGIVVAGNDWHVGLIGIVASRLSERFSTPTIILTQDAHHPDLLTGSARSVGAFDLFEALHALQPHLHRFGGHKEAAGLALRADTLERFHEAFSTYCEEHQKDWAGRQTLYVDAVLAPWQINQQLYDMCEKIEPCGCGNARPIFALMAQKDVSFRIVGQLQSHLLLRLEDGLRGIFFRAASYDAMTHHPYHDIAFHLDLNVFREMTQLQMIVQDVAPSLQSDETDAMRTMWLRWFQKGYRTMVTPTPQVVHAAPICTHHLVDKRGMAHKERYLLELAKKKQGCIVWVHDEKQAMRLFTHLRAHSAYSDRSAIGCLLEDESLSALQQAFQHGQMRLILVPQSLAALAPYLSITRHVWYDIPESIERFDALCRMAPTRISELYVYFLFGEEERVSMETVWQRRVPDRAWLGMFYTTLKRLSTGQPIAVADVRQALMTDDMQEKLEVGFRIFSELSLLEIQETSQGAVVCLKPNPQKTDLMASQTFAELQRRRQAHRVFYDQLLQRSAKEWLAEWQEQPIEQT